MPPAIMISLGTLGGSMAKPNVHGLPQHLRKDGAGLKSCWPISLKKGAVRSLWSIPPIRRKGARRVALSTPEAVRAKRSMNASIAGIATMQTLTPL